MKFILGMTALIIALTASTALACNCIKKSTPQQEEASSCQCGGCCTGQSSCSDELLEVKNTTCPVSGQPVGSMGEAATYAYNGKVYQLCCAGCIDKFKANPEKYIEKIEVNG